jgi:hypothetical protein
LVPVSDRAVFAWRGEGVGGGALLERLIAVKARAGRIKDKQVLPVLIATLERKRQGR